MQCKFSSFCLGYQFDGVYTQFFRSGKKGKVKAPLKIENRLAFFWYTSDLPTTQSTLQHLPHSPIHTHIHTLMAEAAM